MILNRISYYLSKHKREELPGDRSACLLAHLRSHYEHVHLKRFYQFALHWQLCRWFRVPIKCPCRWISSLLLEMFRWMGLPYLMRCISMPLLNASENTINMYIISSYLSSISNVSCFLFHLPICPQEWCHLPFHLRIFKQTYKFVGPSFWDIPSWSSLVIPSCTSMESSIRNQSCRTDVYIYINSIHTVDIYYVNNTYYVYLYIDSVIHLCT